MPRFLMVISLLTLLITPFNPVQPVAAATEAQQTKPEPAKALCLPGIYTYEPGDCLPNGPSAFRSRMAEKGITLPLPPLASTRIDPALGNVDVYYGEVTNMPAPVFSSIEDAV